MGFIFLLGYIFGLALIIKPRFFLALQDIFRIESKVEYTDLAVYSMIFSGIMIIIIDVIVTFMYYTQVY